MNPKIFDLIIILTITGMLTCIVIEILETTKDFKGVERLKFAWWFYIQDGEEKISNEIVNVSSEKWFNVINETEITRRVYANATNNC